MQDSYYSDGYDMVHEHGSTLWSCGYKYVSPNYMAVASVSYDAGTSWTRHELYNGSSYAYLRAIAVDPSNADRVFGLGYQNSAYTLFYTTDGGGLWQTLATSGYTGSPYGLAVCPTNGNLLAAATSGGLYSSSDAGATWSRVTTLFGTCNDLVESNLFDGLLVATSTDGVWLWEDWSGTPVQVGSDLTYPDVECIIESNDYLFAGTSGAAAWRSFNAVGIEEGSSGPIANVILTISPNPVVTHATLSISLPQEQMASIAVYDITGRQIMVAADGIMSEGTSQLTINVSNLSSGIYFARLSTENTAATARMVITR